MLNALLDSRLADCRRIFLRNYTVNLLIGAYDDEKKAAQQVLINVDLFVPLAYSTPVNDQLSEVVNYDLIRNTIMQRIAQGHIHLQETLCDDLAQSLLTHRQIRAVRIFLEKPTAYADCDGVGVEVFHIKDV